MTTFAQALNDATRQAMELDPNVFVMGIAVDGHAGVFGSTVDLKHKFPGRVLDTPVSEQGMTALCMGAALEGLRPILVHQRVDFALYSLDQIVNHIASARFVSGGKVKCPIVIRMIVGKGWGQGPQHSKSLYSWFAHVPGLKVVTPGTPADAKGLLLESIVTDDPVIFIEGRSLYSMEGEVPEHAYSVPLGLARTYSHPSPEVTIVAFGATVPLALEAQQQVAADVVDLRTIAPLDIGSVLDSVRRTHRLVIAEGDWAACGIGSEIIAQVRERSTWNFEAKRVTWPRSFAPTSAVAEEQFHVTARAIIEAAA